MAYTRRQELFATQDEVNSFLGRKVLLENEILYIKMKDGTIRAKLGDGVTTISALPFVQVFDGSVIQILGDSETDAMSQKGVTRFANTFFENIANSRWEQGGLSSVDGGPAGDASRDIRICTDFIDINEFAFAYAPEGNYEIAVFLYNGARRYLVGLGYLREIDINTILQEYPLCKFIRFVMKKTSEANISPSDFEASNVYIAISNAKRICIESENMHDIMNIVPTDFTVGTISNGVSTGEPNRCMTKRLPYDGDFVFLVEDGYEFYLHFYKDNAWLGGSEAWFAKPTLLSSALLGGNLSEADTFVVVVRKKSDSNFTADEISDMKHKVALYKNNSVIFKLAASLESFETLHNRLGIVPVKFTSGNVDADGNIQSLNTRCYTNKITYDKNFIILAHDRYQFYLRFFKADGTAAGNSGEWLDGQIPLSMFQFKDGAGAEIIPASFVIIARDPSDAVLAEDVVNAMKYEITLYKNDSSIFKTDAIRVGDFRRYGLPVLALSGDISAMTKDNAVTLNYKYDVKSGSGYTTKTGTCTCKWQGSSSVRLGYPKRNYTINFDQSFVAKTWKENGVTKSWGSQKKYCMKANWIDPSAARNVVNALLWGQVVKSRNLPTTDKRTQAPNYGAVDGFPIIITINGMFEGLYTFNIPKEGWMFAMGSGASEAVVCGETNSRNSALFRGEPTFDDLEDTVDTDYSLEYPDEEDFPARAAAAKASFTQMVKKVAAITTEQARAWETYLENDLDIDSVIDYFIFVNCIAGEDNHGKNILYGTYDGTKWFMSAYDLDTTFGSNPYGESWYQVKATRSQFAEAAGYHKLAYLLYNYSKDRLKARYKELRAGVLSDENVWYTFANFISQIPKHIYDIDSEKWAANYTKNESDQYEWMGMPGTSMANIHTYMDYYRMHCAYLDKEIEEM